MRHAYATRRSVLARICLYILVAAPLVALAGFASAPARAQTRERARIRLGLQLDVGSVRGADAGFGVGITGRVGVQHGRYVATYYQPRLFVGGWLDDYARDGVMFAAYNTVMLEATFGDLLQVGAGPSLDVGLVNLCSAPNAQDRITGTRRCDGFGGAFFGADLRVALTFGARLAYGRRAGPEVALHVHPTWIGREETVTTVTLGVGFELD